MCCCFLIDLVIRRSYWGSFGVGVEAIWELLRAQLRVSRGPEKGIFVTTDN
ncbi:hypothetical protein HN51_030955, partial [Arachis hypogaea]